MKRKIINAEHNAETGHSNFVFQNKYGVFHGHSVCSPDDMDNFSAFAGERYAELRAVAEYAKLRMTQEKIKLQTIQNLLKDIDYDSKCNIMEGAYILRRIKIKLRDYTQSVEDWTNLYKHLQDSVKIQDEQRQKILNRTKKENNLS